MTISQILGVFCQEWLESVLSVSCPLELSDSKNPKTLRATNPAPTHRPRMKFRDEVKWSEAIKQELDERGWKMYTVEHPQNRARKIDWMNSIESYCNIISSFYVGYRIYILLILLHAALSHETLREGERKLSRKEKPNHTDRPIRR